VVGGSLLLYALRAPKVAGGKAFALVSRETVLLIGNLMFAVAAAMVLLGTLFPADRRRAQHGPDLGRPAVLRLPVSAADAAGRAAAAVRAVPALGQGRHAGSSSTWPCAPASLPSACAIVAAFFVHGQLKAIAGVAVLVWLGRRVAVCGKRWREMPRGRRYPAEMAGMLLAHLGVACS
jgi:cytochrome c-type biogenesis protein CcmF